MTAPETPAALTSGDGPLPALELPTVTAGPVLGEEPNISSYYGGTKTWWRLHCDGCGTVVASLIPNAASARAECREWREEYGAVHCDACSKAAVDRILAELPARTSDVGSGWDGVRPEPDGASDSVQKSPSTNGGVQAAPEQDWRDRLLADVRAVDQRRSDRRFAWGSWALALCFVGIGVVLYLVLTVGR